MWTFEFEFNGRWIRSDKHDAALSETVKRLARWIEISADNGMIVSVRLVCLSGGKQLT